MKDKALIKSRLSRNLETSISNRKTTGELKDITPLVVEIL
jgi:hypothetical protein